MNPALSQLHRKLDACRACPGVVGPVIHGPAIQTKVMLVGQAPGPHEGKVGRPFGWTAGKTLFQWFHRTLSWSEEEARQKVYLAAVARCFPGKAKGGSDRKPSPVEISSCRTWLEREARILKPTLLIPVGSLAIEQVLERKGPLVDFVGKAFRHRFHGLDVDVICLPHPSGASTWHRTQPGVALLEQALTLLAGHPALRATGP